MVVVANSMARAFQWYVFHYVTICLYMKKLGTLLSKYVVASDVVPCMICLIYAPQNVQAVGEILPHHLNISRKLW